ncbi:sterol carrier family protein [Streptomyces sp. NPDC048057]|uniref:maleylpyruvate isomerase family mycothiol-dependent enzyme n=1 Tax=Streptomyces sp. NPDC048057 TaxID=3155628 RepID=UPI0034077211
MPPAKKRTRSYDPAKTRAAVLAQFDHVRTAVAALTPEQLALPTRLGGWTVRELVVHLARVATSVVRSADAPPPTGPELALERWPSAARAHAQADEDARDPAAQGPLDALYARTADDLARTLAATPDDRAVTTPVGALRFADLLVTRTVELIVHTDDLNDALAAGGDAGPVPYDRGALAASTRLLLDALAVAAPGGSVEVRVPPFAVVQCVKGPRHTRGTPPNVVETAPLTWLRLATGRTSWADAVEGAEVSASGERADLSALLPLLG